MVEIIVWSVLIIVGILLCFAIADDYLKDSEEWEP